MRKQYLQEHMPPSFLFILGAPLGDNDSPVWNMTVLHYGPNAAQNCNVHFIDLDRANIRHDWLDSHPGLSFAPADLVGQWETYLHFPEVEAAPSTGISNFQSIPIDPNQQHYLVESICRDGEFAEGWEVARINGALRTKIDIERSSASVERNPELRRPVFECTDPAFVSSPLAKLTYFNPQRQIPPINPGWKPNHRFTMPVMILADTGSYWALKIKGVSVGCWDSLTRHLGDVALPLTLPDDPMALAIAIYGILVLVVPIYCLFVFWLMDVPNLWH
jgi:hypothetical protein